MLIRVNGVRLFVDVANFGLVPDGDHMREKPTLLMLHGGPGFDHTGFKEAFANLGDVAQVIFYDHRGNGRSEGDEPDTWNLDQWADDVKGLLSTAAKIDFPTIFAAFNRIAGPEIGAIAEAYWTNPTAEGRARYIERCVPFYRHRRDRPQMAFARALLKTEVALHFNGPRNEHGRFDFRPDLAKLRCPVLLMAGEQDPIVPMPLAEATAGSIPAHLLRFERLKECGHDIHGDGPERVFGAMRAFIAGEAAAS